MPHTEPAYKRILLKLSGESLLGDAPYGIDLDTSKSVAQEIKETHDLGVQVAIMIGGGNIFRGMSGAKAGMDRAFFRMRWRKRAFSPATFQLLRSKPWLNLL
jgi:uridylate kinase